MSDTRKIGRFEIRHLLGRGAQSSVYLAYDPHLEREVAIKTLHFADGNPAQNAVLLKEARTVSKLRHANLVPIFEAGEQDGDPYLVFEYVEGLTLAQLINDKGPLPARQALEFMLQVLDAVAHAHHHGTVHRDLKPSNILINGEGVPRVMDFGIAWRAALGEEEAETFTGTPAYMSPEYISDRVVTAQSDIFAAGLILYEMLFGRRAFPEGNAMQVIYRIANSEVQFLESDSVVVDEKLRAIIAKAAARDPQLRYETVVQMQQALQEYLRPEETPDPASQGKGAKGTLEFLLRRMRHKSDFPALSEAIRAINRLTSSDRENLYSLSSSILKDFALTNKILRLVNSAFYRQAGAGSISTVSRATAVLGIDAIRSIAVSLILFEHLQNRANAALIKEEFLRANLSGALARGVGHQLMGRNTEEAFICAMFYNLGRLLAQYYFPEEAEEIRRIMLQDAIAEETASTRVLGMGYQDLGIGVAKAWGFPDAIVKSMRRLPAGKVRAPAMHDEKLRVIAAFASEACGAIESADRDQRERELSKLRARFGEALPVRERELEGALERAMQETADFCRVVRLNLAQSKLGKRIIAELNVTAAQEAEGQDPRGPKDEENLVGSSVATVLETREPADAALPAMSAAGGDPQMSTAERASAEIDAQAVLTAGIQDISNSLVEDFSLNDLLRIILETMYRAMGFKRVLLCIRDPKTNSMIARFGLGPELDQLIKRFRFTLGDMKNIFSFVLARGVDILISDASDPSIAQRVPAWYRKDVGAQTFILFPLVIKNVPVALIYADKDRANEIVISDKELGLLRTLRNQAVLAIKQSS